MLIRVIRPQKKSSKRFLGLTRYCRILTSELVSISLVPRRVCLTTPSSVGLVAEELAISLICSSELPEGSKAVVGRLHRMGMTFG
jgi:hypothetical protein